MKRTGYYILHIVLTVLLLGLANPAQAQVPQRLAYQSLVSNLDGEFVKDGSYQVTFRFYADEDGPGQALWSETQTVAVTDGLLSTLIGAEKALDLPFDRPYFLTVQLEAQPESERMALSTAAYALVARDVPDSTVVRSISGLQDAVDLVAGDGIAIAQQGNRLVISASGRQGLKGYGAAETPHAAKSDVWKAGGTLTEAQDNARVDELLSTLGAGGSNTGLDLAYDAGRIVTLDDGQILLLGTGSPIGLQFRDTDLWFRSRDGTDATFRFQVDGASPSQAWWLNLVATTGAFQIYNRSAVTVPFEMTTSAVDGLLRLDGSTVNVGSTTQTADISNFRSGFTGPANTMTSFDSGNKRGGSLQVYDEVSDRTVFIEPDVQGEGGFLAVFSGSGESNGFIVDGNSGGTGNTKVDIRGTNGTSFDTNAAGDASVVLPGDAIEALEILNETGATQSTGSSFGALSGGLEVIESSTIMAPSAGFVLVIGSGEMQIAHTSGTISSVDFGVSNDCDGTPTLPVDQDIEIRIASGASSGGWDTSASSQNIFPVSAGSNTFCIVANETSGDISSFDETLSLVFIPTSYGTVLNRPGVAGAGDEETSGAQGGLTTSEIAAEQAEAAAANQARIDRELAQMRARMAELERHLEQVKQEQGQADPSGGNR